MTTRLHNYVEVRAYLEKEHADWLRALTPRHINAPANDWPQKVLADSSTNAAIQNYVTIHEHGTRPNPALAAVHGQAALLLRYDVPTYYVPQELLAAAARTELPDNMVFEAIPFPFDALAFMLPKGTVRHPKDGDCPFLALSRTTKGQALSLSIPDLDFSVKAEQDAVVLTTYMPEAKFNVTYYKSVPLIPGAPLSKLSKRPAGFHSVSSSMMSWPTTKTASIYRCHWVEPVLVAQIQFTECTSDDQLRQPVFLGLLTDKHAKHVVRGVPNVELANN